MEEYRKGYVYIQKALTVNGKKRNIRKKDLLLFAKNFGIPDIAAEKMMKKLCVMKDKYMDECERSYLPQELKEKVKELVCNRIEVLL